VSKDNRRAQHTRSSGGNTTTEDRGGRRPPHNLEAETALLGAAMLTAKALSTLVAETRPGDFYRPAHGHIAAVMARIFAEHVESGGALDGPSPADPVTVCDRLGRDGLLDDVGGPGEIVSIQAGTASTSNAARYATIVHELSVLRQTIGAAAEIAELGYSLPDDVHAAVLKAQDLLAAVAESNGTKAFSALSFGDVAALLAGTIPKVEPDFLVRSDGQALLYAGKMHLLHGEPSGGKSWIALLAAVEILTLGGAVLYLDYEDSLAGVVGRLLALGAHPDDVVDRFRYVRQDGPFGTAEKSELGKVLAALNPDLVVLDGVAEALSRDGLSEDRATEVVEWIEKLPRWISRTGAAVVLLDHVAKDRETRGRWARGSSAKLAAIDGAAYEVNVLASFSKKRAGRVELKIAKDRHGSIGEIGATAAVVNITPHADGERVVIELVAKLEETASTAEPWRPTLLMAKVSAELERAVTPLTAKALGDLVHGKKELVREAIARLVAEGWVRKYRIASTEFLRLERPFREGEDPPPADPELFPGDAGDGNPVTSSTTPTNVIAGPWQPPPPISDEELFGPGPNPEGDPDR
jgi:hypothetical protein